MKISSLLFVLLFAGTGYVSADPLPSPWGQYGMDKYEAGITRSDPHRDSACAFIKSKSAAEENDEGRIWQSFRPPEKMLGKRIKISGLIKTVGVKTGAGMLFKSYTYYGELTADFMLSNGPVKGTSDWTEYEIVADIPYESHRLTFGVWIKGSGEARADDFRFEIVDYNVGTTASQMTDLAGNPENLDFEAGSGGPSAGPLPSPWSQQEVTEYEAGITTSDSHGGKACAFIKSKTDWDATGYSWLWQSFRPAEEWIGKRVRMSACMKTVDVRDAAGMFVNIYTDGGDEIKDFMLPDRVLGGTYGWARYKMVVDIPYDSNLFGFGIWLKGSGEARVDDFRFDFVGPDVETTAKRVKRKFGEPVNLNFEDEY